MRKFKLPVTSGNLVGLIHEMRTGAAAKLSAFCSQQILDKKLSTKTFKYDFDIAGRRSGGQRKSVQKLREILYKHIKKQIPYLEYVSSGDSFLTMHSSRSNQVIFNLESYYTKVTLTSAGDIARELHNLPWRKSIVRYSRFLNYKALRKGIPLNTVLTSFNHHIHEDDQEAYNRWTEGRNAESISVRIKMKVKLVVTISSYEYRRYTESRPPYINSYDDYEKTLSGRDLIDFRDSDSWVTSDLTSTTASRSNTHPGYEKYHTAEKIFLVLDDLLKVITTLTRRVQYDTAAFNIGSAEAS